MTHNQVEIQAIFAYGEDLVAALKAARARKLAIRAVHSPVPSREIGEVLEERPSPIRFFTLGGAILGILTGFGLSVYTASQWRFIVSGKPPVPMVPYVIVSFEFCILLAVLFNLAGLLLLTRLPKQQLPPHYDPRVTEDRYSLLVRCAAAESDATAALLRENGAEEVRSVS
jgi:molybdopterin-containing oxidoreductase family membrane subunit